MKKSADEKLIEEALDNFKLASDAENENRKEALYDLKFAAGDQWPGTVKHDREIQQRPCLTINRLPQFIKQVTNDQRQNRPQIRAIPAHDGDEDTAEVINGLIRNIQVKSHADVAYDTAFEHAVTGGFGYFRIVTDYESDQSFDQEIQFKRIRNPFCVYFDPNCQEPDYSDAHYCIVIEDVPVKTFEAMYPNKDRMDWSLLTAAGNAEKWVSDDTCRIAEYFYIEQKETKLYQLADGSIVEELPEGVAAIREKSVINRVVNWCKLTAFEVLEKNIWPGKYIPIVPVLGDELDVDGRRTLKGMVRDARDPARMYNYWASANTEMIALAPKAPFIAAAGQIEGFEDDWAQANTANIPVLEYNPISLNGTVHPAPQRQPFAQVPAGIVQSMLHAADDLKAVTGIYDASLGARGNETSGRAILARQKEGDVANFHYIDNLTRALKFAGKILIDLIPKIYDTPRILRIQGIDGTSEAVPVNQVAMVKGKMVEHDLTRGGYDVIVDVGPSYNTQRQESASAMVELARADPSLMQKAPDLIVGQFDWPGAQQLAERLKLFLPPQVQQEGQQPIPPQVQAQMQQMQQTVQQLSQALENAHDEVTKLESGLLKAQMDNASKERIAEMQARVDLIKAEATISSREALAQLKHEIDVLNEKWTTGIPGQLEASPPAPQQEPSPPSAGFSLPEAFAESPAL